ncbi:NTP transferase domain-containing protein [Polycladidibacter hongkongensis]|uniref:NTP transferase domain-containing protein n=1 Tax=Polycladidibacter hongkongensis TaxID=1647556 RepID=UPI00082F4E12|nr:molybdopterin-binding/glycosyltransferase family 2 protein [Pseudovibrio hongkongensis]
MWFGPIALDEAEGCILAHSLQTSEGRVRKGRVLSASDISLLRRAGIAQVVAARLAANDVHEDDAAERIARAAAGAHVRVNEPFTGRANLYAQTAGLVKINRGRVDSGNQVDPAITLATKEPFTRVEEGTMIATAKIISYGVSSAAIERARLAFSGAVEMWPFHAKRVALVVTALEDANEKLTTKSLKALEARLARSGSILIGVKACRHDDEALSAALKDDMMRVADIIVVFGVSATSDITDIIPAGICAAGGEIVHYGMPVDPGNLLVLGKLNQQDVIGAPGCARSVQMNGFDFVLDRLLCNIDVNTETIQAMGVGGLLKEIVSRPQPRNARAESVDRERAAVDGIILAAGASRRSGAHHKLLAKKDSKAIIRLVVEQALASDLRSVHVVTGNEDKRIRTILSDLPVILHQNSAAQEGISSSIRVGLKGMIAEPDACVLLLGDMPEITAEDINRLISGYDPANGQLIGVSTCDGKRGNPVLWSSRFFSALSQLQGDIGGKQLISKSKESTYFCEIGKGAHLDLDDAEELSRYGATFGSYSMKTIKDY